MKIKRIVVDNGETFEGTHEQFRDCFFDNADLFSIAEFCKYNLKAKSLKIEMELNRSDK